MNYPYDLFITFLITRKADINGSLRACQLPSLSEQEKIEKSLFPKGIIPASVELYLNNPDPKATIVNKDEFLAWADIQGIKELWETQPEYKSTKTRGRPRLISKAYGIFANPEQRNVFSILRIREFDPQDIIEIFGEKFNLSLSEGIVDIAGKYFFDFERLGKRDWHSLLQNLPQSQREMLQVGIGSVSKEFVEYKAGRIPHITFEEILNDIMVTSYYKFKATVDQPLMDNLAMKWANMSMSAGERRSRWTGGDKASLAEEVQLRFDFTSPSFKTLAELTEE